MEEDLTEAGLDEATEDERRRLIRGTSVGRYVIINFVDEGGMGAVYKAFDPELDRVIALKILSITKTGHDLSADVQVRRNRLLREAQALAKLSHPNVVTVHDVGTYENSIFIAMEFVAGRTLGDWRQAENPSQDQVIYVSPPPAEVWWPPTRPVSFTGISNQPTSSSAMTAGSGFLILAWPAR